MYSSVPSSREVALHSQTVFSLIIRSGKPAVGSVWRGVVNQPYFVADWISSNQLAAEI